MLPAPTLIYALARNARAQLLWQTLDGAASYTVHRDGAPLRAGLTFNLFVDFGLANGTAHVYSVSATDAGGAEGPQCAPVSVTPAPPTATQFRYRQTLGGLLRWLVATDGLPMISGAFALDQQARGLAAPLLALTDADVVRGAVYATEDPTLAVDVLGETVSQRLMEGLMFVTFTSQVVVTIPRVGGDRPEDRSFAGDVIVDALRALLSCQANAQIPALSPASGAWTLPGHAVFEDCRVTHVLRLNRPVRMENGVTHAPAWAITHEASIAMTQAQLGLS